MDGLGLRRTMPARGSDESDGDAVISTTLQNFVSQKIGAGTISSTSSDEYRPPSLSQRDSLAVEVIDDASYVGNSKGGVPFGFGMAAWPGFRKYSGDWEDGREHGVGREAWTSCSSCYAGEFHDGQRSGFGIYTHVDPEQGKLQAAQKAQGDGRGGVHTQHFPWASHPPYSERWLQAQGGWVYAGQWKFGGRHGLGAILQHTGDLYEGQFQHGRLHGFGVRMSPKNEVCAEVWEHGECKMQFAPASREAVDIQVDVSFDRLRWTPGRIHIVWPTRAQTATASHAQQANGQRSPENKAKHGENHACVVQAGQTKEANKAASVDEITIRFTRSFASTHTVVGDIKARDVVSLRIGDPITHSFVLQYMADTSGEDANSADSATASRTSPHGASRSAGQRDPRSMHSPASRVNSRVKKSVEVQVGKEAYFRLLFLVLRLAIHEAKTGRNIAALKSITPNWFMEVRFFESCWAPYGDMAMFFVSSAFCVA